MSDALEHAFAIVKAQAAVRPMTEDEMLAMLGTLTKRLEALSRDDAGESARAGPEALHTGEEHRVP